MSTIPKITRRLALPTALTLSLAAHTEAQTYRTDLDLGPFLGRDMAVAPDGSLAVLADASGLSHALPQHLPTAELAFIPIYRQIALHFQLQGGIPQRHPVTGRRSEDLGIDVPLDAMRHGCPPVGK